MDISYDYKINTSLEVKMYPNLREETKDKEIGFITAIAKDMLDNNKSWYTNTYEFSTGERFKIEIQKLITEPISKDM